VTPADRHVRVGELRLHYLDFGGSGPPLVFLHATGFHAWLWLPYARRFAPPYHVLALDQRGHGESDKPPTGYRWEQFGADLAGFLDVLDLREVRAVGHSKGATAIAAAAAAGTRRLARAVLIEPVLVPGPPAPEPVWENPLAAGARRRRNVWPSRQAMFDAMRGRMPFETWEEECVRLYVEHSVADRPRSTRTPR
jgi:pimeloyl-ACP methyl ester carboxylesterase